MDNLVTKNDMVGTLKLALHNNVLATFNSSITEYQEFYLKKLLGDYLYWQFVNAIDSGTPDQKWIDLRDGENFTIDSNGETFILKWQGLKNMLKYFMYYEYSKHDQSGNTISGESKKSNLNSIRENPSAKLNYSFNKGRELFGININNTRSQLVYDPIYADCDKTEWLNRNRNEKVTTELYNAAKIIPSAYNFINTNNDVVANTYPNWRFSELSHSNSFNL